MKHCYINILQTTELFGMTLQKKQNPLYQNTLYMVHQLPHPLSTPPPRNKILEVYNIPINANTWVLITGKVNNSYLLFVVSTSPWVDDPPRLALYQKEEDMKQLTNKRYIIET